MEIQDRKWQARHGHRQDAFGAIQVVRNQDRPKTDRQIDLEGRQHHRHERSGLGVRRRASEAAANAGGAAHVSFSRWFALRGRCGHNGWVRTVQCPAGVPLSCAPQMIQAVLVRSRACGSW
jgi:hypothetical protein